MLPMHQLPPAADEACGHDRRDFLRTVGAALGALAAIGLVPGGAHAMPLRFLTAPARRAGTEVAYPVPTADGVTIDKANGVMLARTAGRVIAFNLTCPHQNTALKWNADVGEFQCPKHKSKYRADGTFISGRATRNVDRLGIRRAGAEVVVDLDVLFEQDKDPAAWEAAFVTA